MRAVTHGWLDCARHLSADWARALLIPNMTQAWICIQTASLPRQEVSFAASDSDIETVGLSSRKHAQQGERM